MQVWRKKTVRWMAGGKVVPADTLGVIRRVDGSKPFYGTHRLPPQELPRLLRATTVDHEIG